jgi:demethylmenaquinone methyltransferase / 2-methoxy-6-polyprenyl-1,4-benzoquinol methylase
MHETAEERRAESAAEGGAEKREYVRTVFEQIAPRYDLLNHLLSFNIDRLWRRRGVGVGGGGGGGGGGGLGVFAR